MLLRDDPLLLLGVPRKLDHLQPGAHGLRDRAGIGRRHDPHDPGQVERDLEVAVLERDAQHGVEDVAQRLGQVGSRPVDRLDHEDGVPDPGLAQAAEDAPRNAVLAPVDPLRGVVLAERHVHVGAAERLGGGHGQRRLAGPPRPGQARDAFRRPGQPWAYEQRRGHVLRSAATGRGFHGEQAARPPARREHLDEAALDAVEAAVGAVQTLPQTDRVEPRRRVCPPRQRHGHRGTDQRLLYRLHAGRVRRLLEGAPQHRVDVGRQLAALQGREHPLDARPAPGERAHGRERSLGLAVPRRGRGPGLDGQLDGGCGPLRGVAEHLERLRLVHQTRIGRHVGQAPQGPLLLGRDHVAEVRSVSRPAGFGAGALGSRAVRAAERLQRLAVFVERRRVDEQHLPGAFALQSLHAHRVRPSSIPWAPPGRDRVRSGRPQRGRGEWWCPAGENGSVRADGSPLRPAVRGGPRRPCNPIRRIPAAGGDAVAAT